MSDSNHTTRRRLLKTTAIGTVALGGAGLAGASGSDAEEFAVRDAKYGELARVLRSEQFRSVARDLPRRGRKLDYRRAKAVREDSGDDAFKLAVPLASDDSFDPVDTVEGLHAYVDPNSDALHVIVNLRPDDVGTATVETRTRETVRYSATSATDDQVRVQSGCQYGGITPGYKCMGVYDTEEACTVIGAAAVLIPSDDVTGIGVIDDVLLPAVGAGAAGCALEQAIELGITDWLNACSTNNWVWELYTARWWNPVPQQFLAIPRCG